MLSEPLFDQPQASEQLSFHDPVRWQNLAEEEEQEVPEGSPWLLYVMISLALGCGVCGLAFLFLDLC